MAEDNFLLNYMKLHENTEVPDSFAMWCGLAAVSASMGRSSWLRAGPFTVYPNLFIVLVGASGKVRKSTAINQAEELLRAMEPPPNIVAQKLSPEALIQSVRRIETKDTTQLGLERCTGFVMADELSTFLNKKSYEAGLASLLIALYDCKEKFVYRTVSRQAEEINQACLGMLAGSTVDWIRSGIPEEAVGGGLTSRMIFVYVDKPMPPVPWPSLTDEKLQLKGRLTKQLQSISQINGDFTFDQEGFDAYTTEYMRFYNHTGNELFSEKTSEGYASRRAMHMLKIAMCFSACASVDKTIRAKHIQAAAKLLEDNERFLRLVLSLITSSNHGSELNAVLGKIKARGQMTKADLTLAFANRITGRQLNDILDSLVLSEQIDFVQNNGRMYYQLRVRT